MMRPGKTARRGLMAAAIALAAVGMAVLRPLAGEAARTPDPQGLWAMRFDAAVGPTTETVVGTLQLSDSGRCKMLLRTNVGGLGPADKSSSACAWGKLAHYPSMFTLNATLPNNEQAAWELVLGDGGRRMFMMLTAPQGFPSSGEAVRQ